MKGEGMVERGRGGEREGEERREEGREGGTPHKCCNLGPQLPCYATA